MEIYEEIVKLQREGRKGAVATIVNVRGSIPSFKSAKMLVRDDGSIAGTIGGGCVEAEVWQAAREVMASEKPRTLSFDLNQNPRVRYRPGLRRHAGDLHRAGAALCRRSIIFGAGHVALELYKAARNAGFDVHRHRRPRGLRQRASVFPTRVQVVARDFDRGLRRARSQPSRLTSSSPRAAIATTCAFCAGRCKRRRATSA